MHPGDWVSGEVRRLLVKRMVKETGISEAQANALIDKLGPDWFPLIQEARNIRASREAAPKADIATDERPF